jgi:hypothetical protein
LNLQDGSTAHATDIDAMMQEIAEFLGNDAVTADTFYASNNIIVWTTDGKNLQINVPNQGGNGTFSLTIGGVIAIKIDANGFHLSLAGVHVFTVDNSGNATFKGTVTPSGSPT